MHGNCRAQVKQILEAIEYGNLPPSETEKRLLEVIDNEIAKEDTAADMVLISVAQNLLLELHGNPLGTEEAYEMRIAQLRSRIEATVAEQTAKRHRSRRIFKIAAAIAAILVIVAGIGVPLHRTWFESWSTPDEQQRIIMGHEITSDMVASAIAGNEDAAATVVESFSDLPAHLGFDPRIPETLNDAWLAHYGSVRYFPGYISITAMYRHRDNAEQSIRCSVNFYTDTEYAYFTFEQNRDGAAVLTNDCEMYISENINRTNVCWYNNNVYVWLSGEVTPDEATALMLDLIGGTAHE